MALVKKNPPYIQIFGDATPGVKMTQSSVFFKANGEPNAGMAMGALGLGAAGAFTGYKMWKHHPVLGAFVGLAAGAAVLPIAKGTTLDRMEALEHAIAIGGGVALSLGWKKHPAWGYLLGGIAGSVVASAAIPKPKGTTVAGDAGDVVYNSFDPNAGYTKGEIVLDNTGIAWTAAMNVPPGHRPGYGPGSQYWTSYQS